MLIRSAIEAEVKNDLKSSSFLHSPLLFRHLMFGSVLLTEFLVQANKTETIKQQNQTEKKTLVALLHVVSFSYGKKPLIFTKYAKTKVSL